MVFILISADPLRCESYTNFYIFGEVYKLIKVEHSSSLVKATTMCLSLEAFRLFKKLSDGKRAFCLFPNRPHFMWP